MGIATEAGKEEIVNQYQRHDGDTECDGPAQEERSSLLSIQIAECYQKRFQ